MDAGIIIGLIAIGLTAAGFLALHIFRGPSKQYEDLRAEMQQELTRLRNEVSELRREHDLLEKEVNAIERRLVGEHYSVKEMVVEMRGQIKQLSEIVGELKSAIASIRSSDARRQ